MTESIKIVYPGDIINSIKSVKGLTVLGPGLRRNDSTPNTLSVTRAGKLIFKFPNTYWVESIQKRYIPKKGDLIVGVVIKKAGDNLRIDIGGGELAALSLLAFEGATKKQKPDIQVGDVVYAKVVNAHREMEPELVCVDSYFKAGKLGVLKNDGFVLDVGLNLVQRVLDVRNPLLRTLGKKIPFEIAVGVNGKVWVYAKSCKDVLMVVRALEAAQLQSDQDINEICRQFNK